MAMIDKNDSEGDHLIPAWFTERMMEDQWSFGLPMSDGSKIGIQCINKITKAVDGTLWLDVGLLPADSPYVLKQGYLGAVCKRFNASINASHVLMAYELADT